MGSLRQSELPAIIKRCSPILSRGSAVLNITYQEDITLYTWSCERYHGFHNKHIVPIRHLKNICTHPSRAAHHLHLVDNNGSTLDAVFSK